MASHELGRTVKAYVWARGEYWECALVIHVRYMSAFLVEGDVEWVVAGDRDDYEARVFTRDLWSIKIMDEL